VTAVGPCPACGEQVIRPRSPTPLNVRGNPITHNLTCPARAQELAVFTQPADSSRPTIPIPPSVLRGPADADHYRVKVGRYGDRWYADPLPGCDIAPATDGSWPSVSTIKKASGSDWTFVGLKRVAEALRENAHALDGLAYDECYERLKTINKLGLSRAAQRGTNVHLYFEKGLRGHSVDVVGSVDEPGAEYLPAVRSFFDTYNPELVAAEVVCIHRDLNGVGYGGTSDGLIHIDGKTYWIDWKSRGADSDHGAYAEEAAQLGGYYSAQYMLIEGPAGPARAPLPPADGGLIVSVKPDGVRLYPIDLERAAQHWRHLHAWWCARRDEKQAIGKPLAPRSPTPAYSALAGMAATVDDLMTLYQRAVAEGQWNDELKAAFAARKRELQGAAA
jgi:hypothetical protein